MKNRAKTFLCLFVLVSLKNVLVAANRDPIAIANKAVFQT